ncbi:MAG: hypothetical protein B7Z75_05075 [Acidocella sp. 20-57-95]|nr:MAG: hypothetical protein B7Z75_05075 [Acidocella sp. 20-57-95]OYV60574.1 MAG: hypothetical protein B7Z71_06030 [Acidocella sp. 21-58-7]
MRRTTLAIALSMAPAAAMAEGTMPQMDFQNPLTMSQVEWMAVILVVLYFALSRWGLPQIGTVLEARASRIASDLEAARVAKASADKAIAELAVLMKQAREKAQADIAKAEADSKEKAFLEAKELNDKLDAQLEYSEKQIRDARNAALAAIKPVAADVAATLLSKLTGKSADETSLIPEIDVALAARKAA